eukprot:TRINITY_DN3701_c0_g1_i10.p2 TRINITY_DN3701_c0_g1~~TRINITY_DN3701_c0_g1_i10.p2  ORF type:complete len:199 (+),score=-7.81 TRINITY_DN3701_c0_g1_i10:168-764(+)
MLFNNFNTQSKKLNTTKISITKSNQLPQLQYNAKCNVYELLKALSNQLRIHKYRTLTLKRLPIYGPIENALYFRLNEQVSRLNAHWLKDKIRFKYYNVIKIDGKNTTLDYKKEKLVVTQKTTIARKTLEIYQEICELTFCIQANHQKMREIFCIQFWSLLQFFLIWYSKIKFLQLQIQIFTKEQKQRLIKTYICWQIT